MSGLVDLASDLHRHYLSNQVASIFSISECFCRVKQLKKRGFQLFAFTAMACLQRKSNRLKACLATVILTPFLQNQVTPPIFSILILAFSDVAELWCRLSSLQFRNMPL